MIIDCHMHTPLCGHAVGEPREYVDSAARQGIDLITFTCHIPMDDVGFGNEQIRMHKDQLPAYLDAVGDAAEYGRSHGVEVLCGIEAEYFADEAALGSMDDTLASHPFDFVLGSLHHQVPIYRDRLRASGLDQDPAIIDDYFQTLATGARTGRYNSMSHPDVIRIYGTVTHFIPQQHEDSIRAFLAAARDSDTCIEVNTSGLFKGVYELHPDPLILKWAHEMGVPLTIGSDAHVPERVGGAFDTVLPLLSQIGFRHLHYFKQGQRQKIDLSEQLR